MSEAGPSPKYGFDDKLKSNPPVNDTTNMPDYWDAPAMQPHEEVPTVLPVSCRRSGGIHLSWLHYMALCAIIFFLSVLVTIYTAIALHRADSALSFAGLQSFGPHRCYTESMPNTINFNPHIIVGGAQRNEETATIAQNMPATSVGSQSGGLDLGGSTDSSGSTNNQTQPSAAQENDVLTGSLSASAFDGIFQRTSTMSTSQSTPAVKEMSTVTTTATTTPPKSTVKPSTRYFRPPPPRRTND
jgi:hypothetical protein